ncbi:MAG: dihydrofolate reductase family protein [Anaerolineae bacterium]|nr:dihydrofolate reductase family protein [Anaerolineae bacterium]
MSPRKLIYYVAVTVDHYIAHEDESIDGFATEGQHIIDYLDSLRDFDTVLMGRNTYEWGFQFGIQPGNPVPVYANMMQYVFSQTMEAYTHEQLQVIRADPAEFTYSLKQQEGKAIYLCGGGQLAGYLLKQGLVDEIILKVNPVLFGCGIPLLSNVHQTVALSMLDVKLYSNGVIFQHYAVQ